MKKRRGQALIIVVIVIAIIMAVFANSFTTRLRYHAQEETEIYQREQALYVAETGVNKMIFNINNGTTYNDGDSITGNFSGIGSYTTTYHTPDDPGFGGSGYIESKGIVKTGTVEEISRKVFASVQSGGSSDAFKYCLYTKTGGRDGIADDSYFTNLIHGSNHKYNLNNGTTYTVPYPDPNFYSYANSSAFEKVVTKKGKNPSYTVQPGDLNEQSNVIYIHTKKANATLTISFENIYNESYHLSIITDAKNVILDKMGPDDGNDTNWYGAQNSNDNNSTYPILVHLGSGTATFKFDYPYNDNTTLYLHGFIYTAGNIKMQYDWEWVFDWDNFTWHKESISFGEFDGEVIEKKPHGDLGGDLSDGTTMKYATNYYETPPPHFIVPNGNVTKIFPGSFREEY